MFEKTITIEHQTSRISTFVDNMNKFHNKFVLDDLNSRFIIGNSSAGVREAPVYGVPSINIGSRQNNRSKVSSIINIPPKYKEITSKLENIFLDNMTHKVNNPFKFSRKSDKKFIKFLSGGRVWSIPSQKTFQDLNQTTLSKHFN